MTSGPWLVMRRGSDDPSDWWEVWNEDNTEADAKHSADYHNTHGAHARAVSHEDAARAGEMREALETILDHHHLFASETHLSDEDWYMLRKALGGGDE